MSEPVIEFPDKLIKSGIYAILNTVNDKIYVGSAINLYQRWRDHRSYLKINKHHSVLLQRAWNKHKQAAFLFVVLEYIIDKNEMYVKEQHWIEKLNACNPNFGYNVLEAGNTRLGLKNSEEHNNKISIALKGIKRSEETKTKMSAGKRKIDKWPHEKGWKCECVECKEKRKKSRKIFKSKISRSDVLIGNQRAKGSKRSPEHLSALLAGRKRFLEEKLRKENMPDWQWAIK